MSCTARLAPEPLDTNAEFAEFQSRLVDEGAVVTFVGVTRPKTVKGEAIAGLFLEHHPRLTHASLVEIGEDAGSRFGASAIAIVHRRGHVSAGEAIVFVAAAALHRRAAFEAAEYAMDRLKTEAVFWKREDAVDGSRWIEPTIADEFDRARWSK